MKQIKEGASKSIPTEGDYDPMTDAQAIPTMCTAVFDALPVKAKIFIANIVGMGQKAIDLYHGKDALNNMFGIDCSPKNSIKDLDFQK